MEASMPRKSWRQKKSVILVTLILVFVVLLTAIILVLTLRKPPDDQCLTEECVTLAAFLLDSIDPSVDPCDNFYNFACGKYKGVSSVQSTQSEVDRRLKNLVTGRFEEGDGRSVALQKKYYQACTDLKRIEEDGNETLRKLFGKLGGWPVLVDGTWNESAFDWGTVVEKCQEMGMYYDWFLLIENEAVYYDSNDLERLLINPPDSTHTIKDTQRENYVNLMTNVVKLLGASDSVYNISKHMNDVASFETRLSQIIDESNDTKLALSVEEIEATFPGLPWTPLLRNARLPECGKIILNANEYIPKFVGLLASTPKRVQANYIFWKLTESFSNFLTRNIRKEFDIFDDLRGVMNKERDRPEYCYQLTTTVFAYVSEAAYVRKYTAERSKIKNILDNVRLILHHHINGVKWLDQSYKQRVFSRLNDIAVVIGGPEEIYDEKWFDEFLGVDEIDLSNVDNVLEIICAVDKCRDLYSLDFRKSKLTLEKAKLYKGVGDIRYLKYLPELNLMFLPAATFNSLFYSPNRPNHLNYATLGTVIGHELAHGFGLMGSEVSENGTEIAVWSSDALNNFLNASACLLNGCNDVGVRSNFNASCEKTFEENFADYTGITLSYEAFKRYQRNEEKGDLPGLTYKSDQLFWILYASTMCSNLSSKDVEDSTHMLPFQRILGSFRNNEYFGGDFDCPVGSNMNPEDKCKLL